MPTYVVLCKYTKQGIENIKESPNRLDTARAAFHAAGWEIKDFYLTMGRYDLVYTIDLPNDEAAAKMALSLGSKGNVQTETMRAFNEDEYRSIIGALS